MGLVVLGKRSREPPCPPTMGRCREKMAGYESGSRFSSDIKLAGTLVLYFQPPEL